jgi:23S rRNA pseudouridine1911/1915/1917 synthase
MSPSGAFLIQIQAADVRQRLDSVISRHVENCSRSAGARLIKSGLVTVNGMAVKPGYRVRLEDEIRGWIPPAEPTEFTPEPIPLQIIHEDRHVIVLNKPAGVVVHPAPGHASGTLVNGLLHHCDDLSGIGGQIRPGIVHRLDKDTTGVMVVAKTDQAHDHLSSQFKNRQVRKAYLALVHGIPNTGRGVIDLPIGRHPVERKKMSIRAPHPRAARTRWSLQRAFSNSALLRVVIETGRTHQIRVHMAAAGFPVLGDPVYGSRRLRNISWPVKHVRPNRQMLHAFKLAFHHPATEKFVSFQARLPDDMQTLIRALGRPDERSLFYRK